MTDQPQEETGVRFNDRMLVQLARDQRERSYAKYSDFTVGASVVGESGKAYFGCNIENASYPVGICAERTAVATAIAHGERKITSLALAGGKRDELPDSKIRPCGMCLQFLSEFMDPDASILIADGDSGFESFTLSELFPHAFNLKANERDDDND
jgi:cytidine deaminase